MAVIRKVGWARLLTILFHFIYIISVILGFNIDTKVPIIKTGRTGSYFGYSLALHRQSRSGVPESIILVGAPRDNVTDPDAKPDVRALVRPGAVYQCPISSNTSDCSSIKIDREEVVTGDNRSDQWLGVSVSSQGTDSGLAVACSHLYKKIGTGFSRGLGICFSMTNELDEAFIYEPCEGKPMGKGHGEYGLCQAGISSALDRDGVLAVGLPGVVNWRGTVFSRVIVGLEEDAAWSHTVADAAEGTNPAMRDFYSYLGMSVRIGNILGGKKTIVAGAPRAKQSGQVLLIVSTQAKKQLQVESNHYLTGDQFGSLFGYEVAVVDLNGDGKDDLVVGAPFYHGPGIGGAVYVYMNGPQDITSSTKPVKILSRKMKEEECALLKCLHARFGFALASIGDVNRDNYTDLAVGAPYEGSGAIYIFHGSSNGIVLEPAQRIYASEFVVKPSAFGSAIAGAGDLDKNGYSDLVVGSFMSANIYILRSRPIIDLKTAFEATPKSIDPKKTKCDVTGVAKICFTLKFCVRFMAEPRDRFTDGISLIYLLEGEKFSGAKTSRVVFSNPSGGGDTGNVTGILQLNAQTNPDPVCSEQLAFINKNTKDFLNSIPLQLSFGLKDEKIPTMTPGGALPDINTYPLLNAKHVKTNISVSFIKDCGSDSVCESDLAVSSTLPLTREGRGNVLEVGKAPYIELEVYVVNNGEDAHEAVVNVTLPQSLRYLGISDKGGKYACVPSDKSVVCDIGNPMKSKASATIKIRLVSAQAQIGEKKVNITVVVNTSSNEVKLSDNQVILEFEISRRPNILVQGQSSPESVYFGADKPDVKDFEDETEVGPEVNHTYLIRNNGDSSIAPFVLTFKWPYELARNPGSYLLYMMERPKVDGDGRCSVDERYINPRKLAVFPSQKSAPARDNLPGGATRSIRSRRDSNPSALELKIGGGGTTLDCNGGGVSCFEFSCNIGELKPGGSNIISIRSRLWNRTFSQNYQDEVFIYSTAQAYIDDASNEIYKALTRVYPDMGIQQPRRVPWWIILVATLVGVLLLILLVILLWKCGFFKRDRNYEMLAHKAELEKRTEETEKEAEQSADNKK